MVAARFIYPNLKNKKNKRKKKKKKLAGKVVINKLAIKTWLIRSQNYKA